jgi:hypothetical protein
MIGVHHYTQLFSFEMDSPELFVQEWPSTMILPISASQVVKIIAMWHKGKAPGLSWCKKIKSFYPMFGEIPQ